jgi:hypothetical protein
MDNKKTKKQNPKTSVSEITLEDLKAYIISILTKNPNGLSHSRISDRANRNYLFNKFSMIDKKVAIFKLLQDNKIIKFKSVDLNGKPANCYKVNENWKT